jgi:hypothetical protein
MPGGFHPFHAGHYALYQSAKKAFPDAEVYVAATNDQSERPFPFALKEKLAKLAGVETGHFIQVKSPFQAKEITQQFNPEEDILIFVRSEKDKNESPKPGGIKKDGSPAYFQLWTGKNVQPFAKHAYFAYLPTVEFGPGITSATQIRKAWPTLTDKRKTALVMSLYPKAQTNPKLAQNVVQMFDQVMGEQISETKNTNSQQMYWSDLDEGLSVENKQIIFEEFYTRGNLTEGNSEDNTKYFKSLFDTSATPVKNQKYIVSPLVLINNNVMMLDKPSYMTFLGKGTDGLVFKSSTGQKTYPSKSVRDTALYNVFTFSDQESYDKFRTALSLKFDLTLPKINLLESEEALQFATKAHDGQTRAGGEPYITHPMRVADSIKQYKKSHNLDALINAALLHDTIEDTDTTHEVLQDLFGGLTASLVKELTSDPEQIKKMGKKEYLAHKMAGMSSYALVIKLADRLDNVRDITTAKTPEWRAKYKNETEHILNYIEKTRALSKTHRIFIDLIRNKLSEIDNPKSVEVKESSRISSKKIDYIDEK